MIPDDLRRFVMTSIPSVPYLEAVLLFHAAPDTPMTRGEMARRLYVPPQKAAELLDTLIASGIVAQPDEAADAYRYAPRDEALAGTLDRLAQAYQKDLIAITDLIHDSTRKTAHRFADAFKLRK